jgi:hypothetical protein
MSERRLLDRDGLSSAVAFDGMICLRLVPRAAKMVPTPAESPETEQFWMTPGEALRIAEQMIKSARVAIEAGVK